MRKSRDESKQLFHKLKVNTNIEGAHGNAINSNLTTLDVT